MLTNLDSEILEMMKYSNGCCTLKSVGDKVYLGYGTRYLQLSGDESGRVVYITDGSDNIPVVYKEYIEPRLNSFNKILDRVGKYPSFLDDYEISDEEVDMMLKVRESETYLLLNGIVITEVKLVKELPYISKSFFLILEITDGILYLKLGNKDTMQDSPSKDKGLIVIQGKVDMPDTLLTNVNICILNFEAFRRLYSAEHIRDLIYYVEQGMNISNSAVLKLLDNNERTFLMKDNAMVDKDELYYFVDNDTNVYLYTLHDGMYVLALTYVKDSVVPKYMVMSEDEALPKLQVDRDSTISNVIRGIFKNLK